jgi:hypothetical protein
MYMAMQSFSESSGNVYVNMNGKKDYMTWDGSVASNQKKAKIKVHTDINGRTNDLNINNIKPENINKSLKLKKFLAALAPNGQMPTLAQTVRPKFQRSPKRKSYSSKKTFMRRSRKPQRPAFSRKPSWRR